MISVVVRAALTVRIYYLESFDHSHFEALFIATAYQLIHVGSVRSPAILDLLWFFLGDLRSVFELWLVAVGGVGRVADLISTANVLSVAHYCNWNEAGLVLRRSALDDSCLHKSHWHDRVSETALKLLLQLLAPKELSQRRVDADKNF